MLRFSSTLVFPKYSLHCHYVSNFLKQRPLTVGANSTELSTDPESMALSPCNDGG